MNQILPNFIIAGGVATGTSFLSHAISRHPDIYLPKIMRPECGFFYKSWEYSKGLDYYSRKWFSEWAGQTAVGERSSLYLHGDFLDVPQKIHRSLPNIKLIYCLRNPIERAYANYRFSVLSGFETKSFDSALNLENVRFKIASGWRKEIQPNLYRRRGEYASQLEKVLELFPRRNILFIKSEEMSRNPEETIREVCNFLNIKYFQFHDPGSFGSRSVKSPSVQQFFRQVLGRRLDKITEGLREQTGTSLDIWQKIVSLNLTDEKVPMSERARSILYKHYESHNRKLRDLIGINTDEWV